MGEAREEDVRNAGGLAAGRAIRACSARDDKAATSGLIRVIYQRWS